MRHTKVIKALFSLVLLVALLLSFNCTRTWAADPLETTTSDDGFQAQWMIDQSKVISTNMTVNQFPTNYKFGNYQRYDKVKHYGLVHKTLKAKDIKANQEGLGFDQPLILTFKGAVLKDDLSRTDLKVTISLTEDMKAVATTITKPQQAAFWEALYIDDTGSPKISFYPCAVWDADYPQNMLGATQMIPHVPHCEYDVTLEAVGATGQGILYGSGLTLGQVDTLNGPQQYYIGGKPAPYSESYLLGDPSIHKVLLSQNSVLKVDGTRLYPDSKEYGEASAFSAIVDATNHFKVRTGVSPIVSGIIESQTFTITSSADAGSEFQVTGNATLTYGKYFAPTYKAVAKPGYRLTKITVDGEETDLTADNAVVTEYEYAFDPLRANRNIQVVSEKAPQVSYQYKDNEGNDLPDEVLNAVDSVPETKRVPMGSDVPTPQLTKTSYDMLDGSGTWSLKTTPPDLTNVTEDTTQTYIWEFIPNHKVTYEYVSGTPGKVLPQEVVALTPQEAKVKHLADYTSLQPVKTKVETPYGAWVFQGNDHESFTQVAEDKQVIGTWVFEKAKIDISVTKVWDDKNDQDKIRPNEITVQLLADGKAVDGKVARLTENNQWKAIFINLDKFENETKITYSIKETNVPEGYTANLTGDMQSGFTLTNSHTPTPPAPPTPKKINISVTKVWDDKDDKDKMRPNEITVQLLADGKAVEGKTIRLTKASQWKAIFTDLDGFEGDRKISYSVAEIKVPEGYTASLTGDEQKGFTLTNSHMPKTKATISQTKTTAQTQKLPKTGEGGLLSAQATPILLVAGGVLTLIRKRKKSDSK